MLLTRKNQHFRETFLPLDDIHKSRSKKKSANKDLSSTNICLLLGHVFWKNQKGMICRLSSKEVCRWIDKIDMQNSDGKDSMK